MERRERDEWRFKPLKKWGQSNKRGEVDRGETMERRERKFSNMIAYSLIEFDSKVCNHNCLGKSQIIIIA